MLYMGIVNSLFNGFISFISSIVNIILSALLGTILSPLANFVNLIVSIPSIILQVISLISTPFIFILGFLPPLSRNIVVTFIDLWLLGWTLSLSFYFIAHVWDLIKRFKFW